MFVEAEQASLRLQTTTQAAGVIQHLDFGEMTDCEAVVLTVLADIGMIRAD